MAVLSTATAEDLINLLELFPVSKIKEHWPKIKGRKEDIAKAVVGSQAPPSVVEFVDRYFSCCKQHVYVFTHDAEIKKLPAAGTPLGERVREQLGKNEGSALYLYWAEFSALLTDPYEEIRLKFLWPFRFEFTKSAAVVKSIVLEKNFSAQFGDRKYVAGQKVTDEEVLIASMLKGVECPLSKTDLHKGIKKLWKDYVIDCVRVSYKDPYATESTLMDEECGIREKKPALYEALLKAPLLNTKFKIKSKEFSKGSVFFAKPSEGQLSFPRYTEEEGDSDNVVREILKHNG